MKKASLKLLPVGYSVYHAISQLNRSFEDCIHNLNHVMSFRLFPADHLRTYEVMVEEIRALANQDFAEVINDREFENSAYYEHLRLKWQGAHGSGEPTSRLLPRKQKAKRRGPVSQEKKVRS